MALFDAYLAHRETIVGTELNAASAMDAYKRFIRNIEVDGVYRAGAGTVSAIDAELLPDGHAPAPSLGIGPRRAGSGAGSRVAGEAYPRLKTR